MKKLTKKQVEEIRKLYSEGLSVKVLADQFNVSHLTIRYWVNEELRKKIKELTVNAFKKRPIEERRAINRKYAEYRKNYSRNRYQNEEAFRNKVKKRMKRYRTSKEVKALV